MTVTRCNAGSDRVAAVPQAPPLVDPCAFVVFGATGDLLHRKLIPAIYNVARERLLPPELVVVGAGRKPGSTEQFRDAMREAVNEFSRSKAADPELWNELGRRLFYFQAQFDDAAALKQLRAFLESLDKQFA